MKIVHCDRKREYLNRKGNGDYFPQIIDEFIITSIDFFTIGLNSTIESTAKNES